MDVKRGQGAIEFMVLLGGIIIVSVIVVVLVRQQVIPAAHEQIGSGMSNFSRVIGLFGS